MSAVDLSSFVDFLPLMSFLVIFILVYAVLRKTKIIGNLFLELLVSFLLATMFVSVAGARQYVQNVIPWFAVLLVCLFFILAIIGFVGKDIGFLNKGIGVGFVIVLIIVFIVSALFVFSSAVVPYYNQLAASPRLYGALLLLVISALVSWILVKAK